MTWIDKEITEVVKESKNNFNKYSEKESTILLKLFFCIAIVALLFYPSIKSHALNHNDCKTTWSANWTCKTCKAVHPNQITRCPYCGTKKHTKW
jgi:rubrerythrin